MKIDGGQSVIKVFLVNEESRHVRLNERMDIKVHEGSVVDSGRNGGREKDDMSYICSRLCCMPSSLLVHDVNCGKT